jgi:hypothetical protein
MAGQMHLAGHPTLWLDSEFGMIDSDARQASRVGQVIGVEPVNAKSGKRFPHVVARQIPFIPDWSISCV